jgi:formylglycine-generating enzyme required for sulfatase activity
MKTLAYLLVCGAAAASLALSGQAGVPHAIQSMELIPVGSFEMGDHHGFVDPKHGSDEVPIHTVRLDSFYMGINDVTTREYCEFLNSARAEKLIEVRQGGVYLAGGGDLLADTRQSSPSSRIGWDGKTFSVLDKGERHPMVCVRWHGAAVYSNWLSARKGLPSCYNTITWECDFNKSGFRLPTEAEWEYAARGGQHKPYYNYPWGDDADPSKANVPESRPRSRAGARPLTTPVGSFPPNGYGLYDMAGNVWQWCTEWYERNYYAYSPAENPPGPAQGSPMPDGKPYRAMRGGSWYNGEFGHSRVSNRDPSYFRGPDPVTGRDDPDGPWFHIGFRVILPVDAENRPVIKPTPVKRVTPPRGPQTQ